jgi:hypothetical protein
MTLDEAWKDVWDAIAGNGPIFIEAYTKDDVSLMAYCDQDPLLDIENKRVETSGEIIPALQGLAEKLRAEGLHCSSQPNPVTGERKIVD